MTVHGPGQIAAWQHVHVLPGGQFPGKGFIIHWRDGPQVKPRVRVVHVHYLPQDGHHRLELGAIGGPVFPYMVFIAPGGDAGQLVVDGHGATVVGAVFQVAVEDACITGHEPGAQARQVAAFGQAVKYHAAGVIIAANGGAGLQQAFGRVAFVGIEFGITLIGSHDKVILVGKGDHLRQDSSGNHGTAGVARRAQEQHLTIAPGGFGHRVKIRNKAIGAVAGQVNRGCSR